MHTVEYAFENMYLKYNYMGLEHVLSLNIFIWFSMTEEYFGIYETKNLDVSLKISKSNNIELSFEAIDEQCQYIGKCKNFPELIEFLEEASGFWGFGGVF